MAIYRTILVATDFSDGSAAALRQALRLAERCEATLHVLHVVGHDPIEELDEFLPGGAAEIQEQIEEHELKRLRDLVGELSKPDLVHTHCVAGRPVGSILSHADEIGADLVVLGATGTGGRRFGTVSGGCVRRSRVPVMLIPADSDGAFEQIMSCVDFSECTGRVVFETERLAGVEGSSVSAVHVFDVPWERARWGGSPTNAMAAQEQMTAKVRVRLKRAFSQLGDDVQTTVLTSHDYAAAIVEAASSAEVDLLVVGTTGRTALAYFVLGTTAEKLIRDSGCAVLSVREPRDG